MDVELSAEHTNAIDLHSLIFEFKNKVFDLQLVQLRIALDDLEQAQKSQPYVCSPPEIIWVIQASGYKKTIQNPDYEKEMRKNDLLLQPWWDKKKEAEQNLRTRFAEFLDIFPKIFFLENGAIPKFASKVDLFRFLADEVLSDLMSDDISDEDPLEWLLNIFDDVDCSNLLYSPEPAVVDDWDHSNIEGGEHCVDDDGNAELYEEEMFESEDEYVYEDPYADEYRREMAEEFQGYMEDQYRSDEDGWYYSDDGDEYVSEGY